MALIGLYIIAALIATVLFFKHLRNAGITVSTTFHVVYIAYYLYVPPLVLYLLDKNLLSRHVMRFDFIASTDFFARWFAFILAAIGYIVFLIVFRNKVFIKKKQYEIYLDDIQRHLFYNNLFNVGKAFTIIGVLCIVFVMRELGGYSQMILIAASLRGYNVDVSTFYSPFGAMCLSMSAFIFGASICNFSCLKYVKGASIWLVINLIFTLIYILYNQGRSPLVFFSACLIYGYLKNKSIKESRIILIFMCCIVLVVIGSGSLRAILRGVSAQETEAVSLIDNISSSLSDLSYPYANTLKSTVFTTEYGYRFFKDYYLWFIDLLPSRLFSMVGINIGDIETMTSIVSFEYSGGKEYLGGVPVDFITSGYFQGGVIGLILNCLIVLSLLKFIESFVESLPTSCSSIKFWYCTSITMATILSMDPCKMPLMYLYLFILLFVLREKSIRLGIYRPKIKLVMKF